jgi:hypothetical protein
MEDVTFIVLVTLVSDQGAERKMNMRVLHV